MAVIVQKLVPAQVSGILFTADPTTGLTDRIVIEACPGLGEALVSGRAQGGSLRRLQAHVEDCHAGHRRGTKGCARD